MGLVEPATGAITVVLIHAPAAREWRTETLRVPRGWTVSDVLACSQLLLDAPALKPLRPSLWGRLVEGAERLTDGDRLALCRDLRVDPKEARRQRYRGQGRRQGGQR